MESDDSNKQAIKDSIREKYPALYKSSLTRISGIKRNRLRREINRLGLVSASKEYKEFLNVLRDSDVSAEMKRKLLKAIPLSDKTYKLLIKLAQKTPAEYAQEMYKKRLHLQPAKQGFRKSGRVPGADNIFQATLQVVVNDEEASIRDATKKYFPLHKTSGGPDAGRLSIFTSYDSVKEPNRNEFLKRIAVSDSDTERVTKKVKREIEKNCAQTKKTTSTSIQDQTE